MIYNFNLGMGWAPSGVEYAQSYRAKMFRNIGAKAKFIFTDVFVRDSLWDMTRNIGFEDDEVEWLYSYFTDFEKSPTVFTLEDFKNFTASEGYTYTRDGKIGKLDFGDDTFYRIYFTNESEEFVSRVEMVVKQCLLRKDFYTSGRLFSEYYAPLDNQAHCYQRRFFNQDGSVAFDEIIDGDSVVYKFKNEIFYSKEDFVGYMVRSLKLTSEDIVIIDRTTGIGQSILKNAYPAKIGIVIHADHFSENSTDDDNILWNNYYEYSFANHEHIAFYITATDAQNKLLSEQFEKYYYVTPRIDTIPVGSLKNLNRPSAPRKRHYFITACRLATEKHVDWLVDAIVEARKIVPDVSLDIYGEGGEAKRLKALIKEKDASDYIRLMGQQDLTDVYVGYEAYLSGSTSEGFGLTLMEAIGSGLPIIGFNVRYGNQEFIDEGQNGYKLNYVVGMDATLRQKSLVDAIVKFCTEANVPMMSQHSYEVAEKYLTGEVEKKWKLSIEKTI